MNDRQPVENFDTHRLRHQMLHSCLDELYADFISQDFINQRFFYGGKEPKLLSDVTINELIRWSYEQTRNPTLRAGYTYHEEPEQAGMELIHG